MRNIRAESGQRIFQPENKVEWRGMATGMLLIADGLGIPRSQLPKYDLPDWGMVGTFLPGSDKAGLTCAQISEKLLEHNIRRSRHKISQIIHHMINRQQAIHPHRRAIGRGCFQFVRNVGGIKWNTLMPEDTGLPYIVNAYYFGKPHDQVVEVRRIYGLAIRG